MNRPFIGLAPGNILQNLYIRERIRELRKHNGYSSFIEIGAGMGYVSNILLEAGMTGVAVDLNATACDSNRILNKAALDAGKFEVLNGDFLAMDLQPVDLVISSMVIEHLPDDERRKYFERAKALLRPGGTIISLVPAGMRYWNIEDEVAGHIRRYERADFEVLAQQEGLRIKKLVGLTFPISNFLYSASNRLVKKHESQKLSLTLQERTVDTGQRDVPYKTSFPKIANLLLNPVALYPLHLLQKAFANSGRSMILYCELVSA